MIFRADKIPNKSGHFWVLWPESVKPELVHVIYEGHELFWDNGYRVLNRSTAGIKFGDEAAPPDSVE